MSHIAPHFGLTFGAGSLLTDPTLREIVDDACFVCGRPQRHIRASNPVACESCTSQARLVRGGVRLLDVLPPPGRLDELTVCCVVNPVVIDGLRGFVLFAAGTWRVHRLERRSHDLFEFMVQHLRPQQITVRVLQIAELRTAIATRGYKDVIQRLPSDAQARLNELVTTCDLARAGRLVSERRGAISSTNDVERLYADILKESLALHGSLDDAARAMLDRIENLRQTW